MTDVQWRLLSILYKRLLDILIIGTGAVIIAQATHNNGLGIGVFLTAWWLTPDSYNN